MVTYFVVNLEDREKFEKKFQVPYGYYALPFFQTEDGAIGYVEGLKEARRIHTIVEKWEGGEMEIVYQGQWYSPELDTIH
jgi:hypothetical protein